MSALNKRIVGERPGQWKGGDSDAARLAADFKVLADPVRVRILALVAAAPGITAAELRGKVDLSQSTVSHHMKVLRDAGLITQPVSGLQRPVEVDAKALRDLVQNILDVANAGTVKA